MEKDTNCTKIEKGEILSEMWLKYIKSKVYLLKLLFIKENVLSIQHFDLMSLSLSHLSPRRELHVSQASKFHVTGIP